MIPRSLPARISWGFALLVLLAILLGASALWRIVGINQSVVTVATNSLPSVVALNRVIQSTYGSAGLFRDPRCGDAEPSRGQACRSHGADGRHDRSRV